MVIRDDAISREAWRREASHKPGHRGFRPHLRPVGANLIGLRGEECFAEMFGLDVDLSENASGDGHIDFDLPLEISNGVVQTFPVDCKAALKPKDLIVRVDECVGRKIYVLCRYIKDRDRCELVGWEWGYSLLRSTPKDYGYGILNYWIAGTKLRRMDELMERYYPWGMK